MTDRKMRRSVNNFRKLHPSIVASLAKYPIVTLQLSHLSSVMHLSWYGLPSTVIPLLVSVNFRPQTGQSLSVIHSIAYVILKKPYCTDAIDLKTKGASSPLRHLT